MGMRTVETLQSSVEWSPITGAVFPNPQATPMKVCPPQEILEHALDRSRVPKDCIVKSNVDRETAVYSHCETLYFVPIVHEASAERWASTARPNRRQRQALRERHANCESGASACYLSPRPLTRPLTRPLREIIPNSIAPQPSAPPGRCLPVPGRLWTWETLQPTLRLSGQFAWV